MSLFFIQARALQDNQITLTGDLAHHLRDVLRCLPGEIVNLVDERQIRYRAAISQITNLGVTAKILQIDGPQSRPAVSVTLAQSVLKGEKMDWVVQKATELGVNTIVPIITERTIARPRADRKAHRINRWQRIAKESSQQCGRSDIPIISGVLPLDTWIKNSPDGSLKLVPWEQERDRSIKSALTHANNRRSIAVLIGPEGGLSPSEIELARKKGWVPVSLGPRILRAETAGLAVLAILQYEFEPDDMNGK